MKSVYFLRMIVFAWIHLLLLNLNGQFTEDWKWDDPDHHIFKKSFAVVDTTYILSSHYLDDTTNYPVLAKIMNTGQVIWSMEYPECRMRHGMYPGIDADSAGNVYLAFDSWNAYFVNYQIKLVHITDVGGILNTVSIDAPSTLFHLLRDPHGNIVVIGELREQASNFIFSDSLDRIDTIPFPGRVNDEAWFPSEHFQADTSGGIYIKSYSRLYKFDADYSLEWTKFLDENNDFERINDTSCIGAWAHYGLDWWLYMVSFHEDGTELWRKGLSPFSNGKYLEVVDIEVDPNGFIIVEANSGLDMVILKLDLNGNLIWETVCSTDNDKYKGPAYYLELDSLGQIYVLGQIVNASEKYLFIKVYDTSGIEISQTKLDFWYDNRIVREFRLDNHLDLFISGGGYIQNNRMGSFIRKLENPYPYVLMHQDVSCIGGSDGQAWVNAYFGTPPYTYQWGDAPAGPDSLFTGLAPNKWYKVSVSDDSGMSFNDSVFIAQPSALSLDIDTLSVSCRGWTDGKAVASASGGTPPYAYLWNDQAHTADSVVTDLAPEIFYIVSVTDSRSCEVSGGIALSEAEHFVAGTISGQRDVRPGLEYAYAVRDDTSSFFTWMTEGGSITQGQGTHFVSAQWDKTTPEKKISVYKTNGYLCTGDTSMLEISLNTTGIKEPTDSEFQIAPNPASGSTTIYFPNKAPEDYLFRITDLSGRIMLESLISGEDHFIVPLHDLRSGVYLVKLVGSRNYCGKLVVQ